MFFSPARPVSSRVIAPAIAPAIAMSFPTTYIGGERHDCSAHYKPTNRIARPVPSTETTEAEFAAIRAWLPSVTGPGTTHIVTHGADVFVGPDITLKIKRPVSFAYMDFGTRQKRQAACLREIAVNRQAAPGIYLGVDRITREPDGTLALNGRGDTLEYAVRMRSFPIADTLDRMSDDGRITSALATALGDMIARNHAALPEAEPGRGRPIESVRARLVRSLDARAAILGADDVTKYKAASEAALMRCAGILTNRRDAGALRRCHGDLHLGNIVLWQGAPLPFDAIEFDEDLATIDPLYDLAFALMDLVHRGRADHATMVLNRYLWRRGQSAIDDDSWPALAAMPLLISLRAIVRAVVGVDRVAALRTSDQDAALTDARRYLATANAALATPAPRLVAVGGLSGSGKSTLARALAPGLGAVPGAIHLRTDLERKSLLGLEETDRIGSAGYTPEMTEATYARLALKAGLALRAGMTVITDAVFARPDERAAMERIAADADVPFIGLWLDAAPSELHRRVTDRTVRGGDASDATSAVLDRQLRYDLGTITWQHIDASGPPEMTLKIATRRITVPAR